jgi:hypothetical protein
MVGTDVELPGFELDKAIDGKMSFELNNFLELDEAMIGADEDLLVFELDEAFGWNFVL